MSMSTVLKLEQALFACWGTKDDLEVLYEAYYDTSLGDDPDKVANLLLGITELHNIKSQRAFDLFEQLLKEQRETNEAQVRTTKTGRGYS